MSGKKTRIAVAEKPKEVSTLKDAVAFVKKHATAKFDETIELHIHLGVDPKQSDQAVRGTVSLPSGAPTAIRVAVFVESPALQEKAREAGADLVGGAELVDQVASTKALDADVAVTTPDMMKELAKIARVLGPRGLMPNPKTGTIGPDPAAMVKSLKGGKVSFKMDDSANIHVGVAKASWEEEKIVENLKAVIDAVKQARPATAKGEFLRSATVASTMGVGIPVQF